MLFSLVDEMMLGCIFIVKSEAKESVIFSRVNPFPLGNKPAVDHTSKPTSQSNLKSVIPVRAEATSSQPAVGSKIRKQPASFSTFKLPASAQNDATETNGKGTKRQLELQGSTVAAPKSKKKRVSSETGSVSGEDIGHSRRTRRKLTDSGDGETETNEKVRDMEVLL